MDTTIIVAITTLVLSVLSRVISLWAGREATKRIERLSSARQFLVGHGDQAATAAVDRAIVRLADRTQPENNRLSKAGGLFKRITLDGFTTFMIAASLLMLGVVLGDMLLRLLGLK